MNDERISDSELVSQFRKGNDGAFEVLLRRHKSRVFTAVYLIVKDRYVAEDLLQETFIKVINTIREGRYNEEGKFLPWVSRIAHNMAIDHFRRNRRYPEIIMEDGDRVFNSLSFSEDSAEERQILQDTKSKLRSLILDLPIEQRQVLIMRHYFKMSFLEIADRTEVSINTALGRMRYALINLRKKLHPPAYDKDVYKKRFDQVPVPRDDGGGRKGN